MIIKRCMLLARQGWKPWNRRSRFQGELPSHAGVLTEVVIAGVNLEESRAATNPVWY